MIRSCPLCEVVVPNEVPHYKWKNGTDEKLIHQSCARKLSEMVLKNVIMNRSIKRDKKKRVAVSEVTENAPAISES